MDLHTSLCPSIHLSLDETLTLSRDGARDAKCRKHIARHEFSSRPPRVLHEFDSRSNVDEIFASVSETVEMIRGKGGNIWLYPAVVRSNHTGIVCVSIRVSDFSSFFHRFEIEERCSLLRARIRVESLREIYRQLINNRRGVNCSRFCFDFPLCI